MDPRFSLKVYPRKDKLFQIKSSYTFDSIKSRVYEERKDSKKGWEELNRWFVHGIIGFMLGGIAWSMGFCEEHSTNFRSDTT